MRHCKLSINVDSGSKDDPDQPQTSKKETYDLESSDEIWAESNGVTFPEILEVVSKATEALQQEASRMGQGTGEVYAF